LKAILLGGPFGANVRFDPTIGLMHADKRYRPSLASDLMEPARPVVDPIALDVLNEHRFGCMDVFETREGVCRLGPRLARQLAEHSRQLREEVGPHAEGLARDLLGHRTIRHR
jgi:CRISPR/Cas system-associated endonuclease Cas1